MTDDEAVIRALLTTTPDAAVGGEAGTGGGPGLDDEELTRLYRPGGTPWLRVNFVTSLDGSATRDGLSGGLSDAADRRVFSVLRRLCDGVLVGAGTVRAEGYGGLSIGADAAAWRRGNGYAAVPRLAIVTDRLALDPTDAVFGRAETPPVVITSSAARREGGAAFADVAEVVDCGKQSVDAARIPGLLAGLGLPRILCEGGPALFGSLAAAGAVDELCLTASPVLVGGGGPRITRTAHPFATGMRLAHLLAAGDTLLLRYLAQPSPATAD